MQVKNNVSNNEPLAIFAGRGSLPKMLIEDCQKNNRIFKLFLLESEKYDINYQEFSPITLKYGEIDKFLAIMREHKIENLTFIGGVTKPNFSDLKVDKKAAILLTKILANKILGDDAVLKTVVKFFEKEGLRIIPIDQILDSVIATKGVLTNLKPSSQDQENIKLGIDAIKNLSKFDIGQSLVIAQKQIIAIEAAEGTDAMIKRCANLKLDYVKNAILVKMKKHNQSVKADLPTIGVETIINCASSSISGIAIEASSTLILQKEQVIDKANELGLFLTVI